MWNWIQARLGAAAAVAAGLLALVMIVPTFTLGRAFTYFILIALVGVAWHVIGARDASGKLQRPWLRNLVVGAAILLVVFEIWTAYLGGNSLTERQVHGAGRSLDATSANLAAKVNDPKGSVAKAHRSAWTRDTDAARALTDSTVEARSTRVLTKRRNALRWQLGGLEAKGEGTLSEAVELRNQIRELDREIKQFQRGMVVECDHGLLGRGWTGDGWHKAWVVFLAFCALIAGLVVGRALGGFATHDAWKTVGGIAGLVLAIVLLKADGVVFDDPDSCGFSDAQGVAADCSEESPAEQQAKIHFLACVASTAWPAGHVACGTDPACCGDERHGWLVLKEERERLCTASAMLARP